VPAGKSYTDVMEEDDCVSQKKPPAFSVGSFVVAVYDGNWYMAQVEVEEPENECKRFTLLKYMDRKGHNKFVLGGGGGR
jgi:hypothetical protein